MNTPFQHIARSQRFLATIGGTAYVGLKIRPLLSHQAGRQVCFNAILYPLHKELVGNPGLIACIPSETMVEKAA